MVVIGADAVRDGKVEGLLAAGADDIVVIAPEPGARLDELEPIHSVAVRRRAWRPADLDGAFLVVAASRDPGERDAIARAARVRHALVNVMDDIPNCDWSTPSVVRRGELVVSIATGGASPALAKKLREHLAGELGEEWSEVLRVLRSVREQTMPSLPEFATRARRWGDALDLDEAARLVREGRSDELEARLRRRLLQETHGVTGRVVLVGAGPGDPDLITVKGAKALADADVVVYDRLVSPACCSWPRRAPSASTSARNRAAARCRSTRSTRSSCARRSPAAGSYGSREATRSCSAGAARRCSHARRPVLPVEIVPGVTSAVAAPGGRRHPADPSRPRAFVRGRHGFDRPRRGHRRSRAHGDGDRHARGAHGRREAGRDLRHLDRGRPSRVDPRRHRAVGMDRRPSRGDRHHSPISRCSPTPRASDHLPPWSSATLSRSRAVDSASPRVDASTLGSHPTSNDGSAASRRVVAAGPPTEGGQHGESHGRQGERSRRPCT